MKNITHLKKILFCIMVILPFAVMAEQKQYMGLSPYGMVPISDPNKILLSNEFPVYTDGNVVINHPAPGFTRVTLPVDNSYTKAPGCYLACYAHDAPGVYRVGGNIYVHGMVRVKGYYNFHRICEPIGYARQDISGMKKFKQLCNDKIATCAKSTTGGCWAGGDTGGWYGMQQ